MNLSVGGEDNPALDVEWRKAAELARISEDTTAKQKVLSVSGTQSLFEMTTVGRNESVAKTEPAINSNRRSDSIMLQRSLYLMGGVAVISLLIASTALALVLIIMSQSPPSTLTDPGTVHARSHSAPIDQGIQNLAKSLQKAQIELENIWMVINSTARRTSNLGSKLREETNSLKTLIESLKIQLHKQSLLSQENKTTDLSLRLELTQRELKSFKDQLTVRTVALWNSQNSTIAELDKLKAVWTEINSTVEKTFNFPDKKIQNLEILINVTRREAEKSNWQHSTALWSAGNFTAKEFRRVWTSVNASQAVFSRELRKVRNNFAQKLNQSIVLLQSSDASLFKSLVGINATIAEKVNNVSKMMGPIGPRGFNGSQGPPGPMGSIGPAGPKGTGDLSTCQYKTKKVEETPGDQTTIVVLNEPAGKKVIGVTCSANYGAENNLSSRFHNNIQQYFCSCRKTDAGIGPSPGVKRSCFSHYWQCPLTT